MRSSSLTIMCLAGGLHAQSWVQLPDLPAIERDDGSAFVIGEEVYVGTGMDGGFQLTADWYRFTPSTNTWTAIAPMPTAGRQYCTTFSLNGQGYVVGGIVAGVTSSEVWKYDPPTDLWTSVAPLLQPLYAATSFAMAGYGHVVSGFLENGQPSNIHLRYDPVTDGWSARPDLPGPGIHRASSFVYADNAYVIGGSLLPFEALGSTWTFDAELGTWEGIAPLPAQRFSSDAVGVVDGGVLVGGATEGAPFVTHGEVWHYHTSTDQWQPYPSFPAGTRRSAVIAFTPPNRVYYGTGSDMAVRYKDWWMLETPVTVEERNANAGFFMGPVPAQDHLILTREDPVRSAHIIIRDATGRLIHQEPWRSGRTELPTRTWSNGTYHLTVNDGATQEHRRFVIQH